MQNNQEANCTQSTKSTNMELHRILCNDKVAMDETTGNHFELPFPLKKIPPRDASSFVGASQKFDEVDRVNSYSMYVTPKASEVVESSDRQSPGNVIERKIRKRAATLLALANTSRRKMKAEPAVDKRMLALGKKPSSKQFVAHLVKSSVESSSGNTNDAAVKADYMCVARINSQCRIMLTEENANTQCKSEIVNDLQCTIVDCKRAALSGKLCALHGGGSRCIVADCGKLVVSKNRCRKHGGIVADV